MNPNLNPNLNLNLYPNLTPNLHPEFEFQSGKELDQEKVPLKAPDIESGLPKAVDRTKSKKRLSKTLFTEWRSFFHLFHAFDRLWIFLIVAFQVRPSPPRPSQPLKSRHM